MIYEKTTVNSLISIQLVSWTKYNADLDTAAKFLFPAVLQRIVSSNKIPKDVDFISSASSEFWVNVRAFIALNAFRELPPFPCLPRIRSLSLSKPLEGLNRGWVTPCLSKSLKTLIFSVWVSGFCHTITVETMGFERELWEWNRILNVICINLKSKIFRYLLKKNLFYCLHFIISEAYRPRSSTFSYVHNLVSVCTFVIGITVRNFSTAIFEFNFLIYFPLI